jgi:colanic acid/amylovoran biosynthesis glycosyltransferase
MKGVNHLPLVADHLRKLGVPFKMSICGDGEYLPQLKKMYANWA